MDDADAFDVDDDDVVVDVYVDVATVRSEVISRRDSTILTQLKFSASPTDPLSITKPEKRNQI